MDAHRGDHGGHGEKAVVCTPRTEASGGPSPAHTLISTSSTGTGRKHIPAIKPSCQWGSVLWPSEQTKATEILAGQVQCDLGSCVHTLGEVPEASVILSIHQGSTLPVQVPLCRKHSLDTRSAQSSTGPPPNQTLASVL